MEPNPRYTGQQQHPSYYDTQANASQQANGQQPTVSSPGMLTKVTMESPGMKAFRIVTYLVVIVTCLIHIATLAEVLHMINQIRDVLHSIGESFNSGLFGGEGN